TIRSTGWMSCCRGVSPLRCIRRQPDAATLRTSLSTTVVMHRLLKGCGNHSCSKNILVEAELGGPEVRERRPRHASPSGELVPEELFKEVMLIAQPLCQIVDINVVSVGEQFAPPLLGLNECFDNAFVTLLRALQDFQHCLFRVCLRKQDSSPSFRCRTFPDGFARKRIKVRQILAVIRIEGIRGRTYIAELAMESMQS
ncbi:hypothetical protein, partial [Paraburkholderia phenoliruptrix]|uniref:hypothetical protein n=1 Tax=Paraburkholderia phenoliruptrix TaxID=252970 RepID=UPI0034D00A87